MSNYLYEQKSRRGEHELNLNHMHRRISEIRQGPSLTRRSQTRRANLSLGPNRKRIEQQTEQLRAIEVQNMRLLQKLSNPKKTIMESQYRRLAPGHGQLIQRQKAGRILTQNEQLRSRVYRQKSHYQYADMQKHFELSLRHSFLRRKTIKGRPQSPVKRATLQNGLFNLFEGRNVVFAGHQTLEERLYLVQLSQLLNGKGCILLQELSTSKQFYLQVDSQLLEDLAESAQSYQLLNSSIFQDKLSFVLRVQKSDGRQLALRFERACEPIRDSKIEQQVDSSLQGLYQESQQSTLY